MGDYGILTLIPPLCVLIFALLTKLCMETLLCGVIAAFILAHGLNFFGPMMDSMYEVMGSGGAVWVVMLCFILGIFGTLTESVGASQAFVNSLKRFFNTEKKIGIAAFIFGCVMFIDDYLNMTAVSSAMKKSYDDYKIPREMLAYNMNSTAGPVCLLIPFSSWMVFFSGIFGTQPELQALGSGQDAYISAIPFMFYPIVALIVVPLVILGVIPHVGPMKKAFQRVAETGEVYSKEAAPLNRKLEMNEVCQSVAETGEVFSEEAAPLNDEKVSNTKNATAFDLLLPLGLLIAFSIIGDDVLIGLIAGSVGASVWYLVTRKLNVAQWGQCISEGLGSMAYMAGVCACCLWLKDAMDMINLPGYVIERTVDLFTPELFPAVTFIVVTMLVFGTGSSWGVPAVAIPIIVPLAFAVDANIPLTLGALLSATGFGCQACFYSSDLVLAAQVCGVTTAEHFKTQFPYAMGSAIIALIGFLIFGFIM